MSTTTESNARADRGAAWAVGVGVGLLTLMITWLVGNRLFGLVLQAPLGPTIAFVAALLAGAAATIIAGQRCARTATRN